MPLPPDGEAQLLTRALLTSSPGSPSWPARPPGSLPRAASSALPAAPRPLPRVLGIPACASAPIGTRTRAASPGPTPRTPTGGRGLGNQGLLRIGRSRYAPCGLFSSPPDQGGSEMSSRRWSKPVARKRASEFEKMTMEKQKDNPKFSFCSRRVLQLLQVQVGAGAAAA